MLEKKIRTQDKGCPFGRKKCEGCNLFRPLYLTPEPGRDPIEEWDCSINHLMILQSENKNALRGVQQAVESRGNSMVKEQQKLVDMATGRMRDDLRRLSGH